MLGDLKLVRVIKSFEDCLFLQSDLIELERSCTFNSMVINMKKCSHYLHKEQEPDLFSYSLLDLHIQRVIYVRYLGVTIT
ncbi:hypothetical protein J6590_085678 [Homalodisca vitripennis]|nr:hypothetical protein J6590_085678 [Homalodisca vitripennis]